MERSGRSRKKWRTEKWGGFAGIDRCAPLDSAPLKLFGLAATVFDNPELAEYIDRGEHLVPHPSAAAVTMDRFDVRLLLDSGVDDAQKRKSSYFTVETDVDEEEMDLERYRDLKCGVVPEEDDYQEEEENVDTRPKGVAIPYDYGTEMHSTSQSKAPPEPCFVPDFEVPVHLSDSTPSSERIHRLMCQTARFVREAGGQAEVMLRVKQGNNPNFSFLLPDDRMFPYYKWLVEANPQCSSQPPALTPPTKEGVPQSGIDMSTQQDKHRAVSAERSGSLPSALQPLRSYNSCGSHEEDASSSPMPPVAIPSLKADAQGDELKDETASPIDESVGDEASPTASPRHAAVDNETHTDAAASSNDGVADSDRNEQNERVAGWGASPEPGVPGVDDIPEVDGQLSAETKGIVEKLILFIQRIGPRFERVVRAREKTNPKFGFMLPWHPHHPEYKRLLISTLGQDVAEQVFSSWDTGAIDGAGKEAVPLSNALPQSDHETAEKVGDQQEKRSTLQCKAVEADLPEEQNKSPQSSRSTADEKKMAPPPQCDGEGQQLSLIKANPRFTANIVKKDATDHQEHPAAKSGSPSKADSDSAGPSENRDLKRIPNGANAGSKAMESGLVGSVPRNQSKETSPPNEVKIEKVKSAASQARRELSPEEKRAQRRLKVKVLLEKAQAEKLKSEVAWRTQRARAVLDHRQAFLNDDDDDGSIICDDENDINDNEPRVCLGPATLPYPTSELPALTEVVTAAAEHAKRHQEAFVATLRDPTQVISRGQSCATIPHIDPDVDGPHDRKLKRHCTSPTRRYSKKRHRDDRESSKYGKLGSGRSKHKKHKKKGERYNGNRRRRSLSLSSDSDMDSDRALRRRVR